MFRDRYKNAYDTITPSMELVSDTLRKVQSGGGASARKRFAVRMSIAAAAAAVCLVMAVPVCAAHIPAFYQIVEYVSPAMADRLIPIEKSCTSQGITMQVEAIDIEGNEADIILSLRDAENSGQDLVHGAMDLFDSYGLSDYTNDSVIGGCCFLTYEEAEDKAYFQVMLQADSAYQSDKLQFRVNSVLCGNYNETKDVDLSGTVYTAETKTVTLNGSGGPLNEDMLPDFLKKIPATAEDPRPRVNVLDLMSVSDCAADDFTVMGTAYEDGVLRVQVCMGDNSRSDRHVELFLRDPDGNERYEDHSVSWHEEVGGARYQIYEFWFLEDIADIADYSMYGIFHYSGELVEGPWQVTFRVEGD